MNTKRKRIAIFVGQADEEYQTNFITGFITSAFGYDMDVCVFSMYRKYQNTVRREKGETNIFSLFNPAVFDGAVIIEDTIQTAGEADRLEEKLHSTFRKPVIVIEKDSKYFESIFTSCHAGIVKLVSHLIEDHGCRDIAFLAGKKWHKHTRERLQAVRDALKQHGLSLPKSRIIYGDFWYQSGELCADTLIADGKLPDAVVCANDAMAIGLCKAFEERGIKVPDNIAVASYDSLFEGRSSPKPITSCFIPSREFGNYIAGVMKDRFEGKDSEPFKTEAPVFYGETCGCTVKESVSESIRRKEWDTVLSEEGFASVNNMMADDLMMQNSIEEFMGTVYSYAFQIKGVKSFHLCLNEWWQRKDTVSMNRGSSGYPERMIHAVRYNSSRLDGIAGLDQTFASKDILPGLDSERDEPSALFFTPIYNEDDSFGYAVVEYDIPRCYDETFRNWIGLVGRALGNLKRTIALQFAEEQLERLRSSKFAALNAAFEKLSDEERADYELVGQILDKNLFIYHFQPIVNTVDGEIYSYEALMRTDSARKVAPLSVIKYADMQSRLQDVEKATFFNVLRIIDKEREALGDSKIFINSIPGVKLSDEDLETVEGYLDRLSNTVVIELTEEGEMDDSDLERLKELFRKHNIKIAVDDYGTGYSNVSNLLRYMPNYVKIDRELLSEIESKPQKQHFVKEIITFCHDNDIMALAEGVETSEELRTVIHLGADLIQGFYTGRPQACFITQIDSDVRDEIASYHREVITGSSEHKYVAGKTNRVALASMEKNNCTEIVVGQGAMIYKDITIFGAPGVKSNVHIRIEPEYAGCITLENVYLSNTREKPCIDIGENADVTLVVTGENTLRNSGIKVPESSRLTVEGDGNIKFDLYSTTFYGIGNQQDAATGELIFMLSGTVEISCRGAEGVCIGAGLGGKITIKSGKYILELSAHTATGIGCLSGNADISIDNCNITVDMNAGNGCCIGSIDGCAGIDIARCSLKVSGDGTDIVCIGSLNGERTDVSVDISGVFISVSAVRGTGIGALNGATSINASSSLLKTDISGDDAFAMGGLTKDQHLTIRKCDLKWNVNNKDGRDCLAAPEDFVMINSRGSFSVNGETFEREGQFE
ncbi:EAL domain, c-di-GMP-specific phosphodiesterase class I (or its enzymatically inactive variant) [Ruminococcaceae bacterium FB2012]|nr:EAL domain, c-di-GMP-specific phosphodiesterase class I (or its enzymatically inactive variant) [Ruminococcaceae bacterium FB2012]